MHAHRAEGIRGRRMLSSAAHFGLQNRDQQIVSFASSLFCHPLGFPARIKVCRATGWLCICERLRAFSVVATCTVVRGSDFASYEAAEACHIDRAIFVTVDPSVC